MSYGETMDDSLWSNLPAEIITADVLPRLPFKTLCRFKCVSPSWNSLISSPSFSQTHYPLKAILFSSSRHLYSVDFADANPTAIKLDSPWFNDMDRWFRSLSSCNGLVLVSDKGVVNFLMNPSTSEYKKLPYAPIFPLSSHDVIYPPGLGYDSSTDYYKVVLFFYVDSDDADGPNDANATSAAVYSLKADSWRTIPDFRYTPVSRRRGVCFNERLHWLCWRTGRLSVSKFVVAFDLANEVFGEMQLPASYNESEFRVHDMVVLEGCLCLLIWSKSGRIDVWMMMEYGVRESWTRFAIANPAKYTVDVLCLSAHDEFVLRREHYVNEFFLRRVLRREHYANDLRGEVVDEFGGGKLVLYNPKQGTRRDVVVSGIPTNESIVGANYMENLVSPNNEERIRRQGEA